MIKDDAVHIATECYDKITPMKPFNESEMLIFETEKLPHLSKIIL